MVQNLGILCTGFWVNFQQTLKSSWRGLEEDFIFPWIHFFIENEILRIFLNKIITMSLFGKNNWILELVTIESNWANEVHQASDSNSFGIHLKMTLNQCYLLHFTDFLKFWIEHIKDSLRYMVVYWPLCEEYEGNINPRMTWYFCNYNMTIDSFHPRQCIEIKLYLT